MSGSMDKRSRMTGALFTLILFLVFVLSALFLVLMGGKVYENINHRMEAAYREDVALSYIANKVRQGDEAGGVSVKEVSGTTVLEIKQVIEDSVYVTDIYYQEGKLWELFSQEGSGLSIGDGNEILSCSPVTMEMNDGLLHIKTEGTEGGSLWLTLRSKGAQDE